MSKKFLGGVDLVGQRMVNVGDPSASTDAVNLQTLQAAMRGLSWKASVRAASTTNHALTAPGATMDGVTLANGDRVLLKNQTAGAENGIYVWNGAASPMTRSTDADIATEMIGAAVFVTEGSTNADKGFTQNADSVTLGTTTLVWAQFGGGNSYTAGNGLTLSSGAFVVLPTASGGIVVDSSGVKVDTAIIGRKYAINVPSGSTTATISHNLGTTDIIASIIVVATGEVVDADVVVATVNTISITFGVAPTVGQYRCVVHG